MTVTNPTISILTVTYTGNSINPSLISVINNDLNITDQASIGSGNAKTNAGSYDIAIQFNSNNIETNGTITGTFTINPKSYNALTYNPIAEVFYTNDTPTKGATPSVLIQDGDSTLVEGTDYDLKYSNNKAVGEATVEITLKGNYVGSKTLNFNIVTASYTITYVDGETELATQTYHSSDNTVHLQSALKDYYTGQWKIQGTYTFLDFNDDVEPSELGGNVTLETVWTPEEYNIAYEPNGGTNSSSNPARYNIESATITLDAPLERTGATFVGWYTESTFTNLITEIVTGSHGNIDLFAKWNYTEYDITYNLNGGTNSSSNPAKYTIITDTITLANPTKDYYDFAGWFSDENCTAGYEVTQITKGSYGAVEIFAKWTLHEYEITYKYNISSSNITNTNALKYTLGNGFNLVNAAAYTYEFAGWYTDLEMQTPITALSSTNPKDITIYGKFNSSNTSIEKYYNGILTTGNACGTITNNMSTKLVGEEVTVTATVASGYNFLGWYLNDSDTPFETGLEFTFTLTTNTVVYKAKYSGNKLNYSSADTNRGTVTGSVTNNTNVSVGTEVTLTASTKTGYTFIGWFKNNASTAESTSLSFVYTMEDADINFIAKWIKVTTLSNNTTRGNVSSLTSTYVLTDTPTITATANTGYYFLGWYIGENEVSTEASYNITMPTVDTTYTAHFINNNITVKNYIVGYSYSDSKYTISYTENNNIGSTPTITNVGSTLTYTMPDNNTYIFAGWYDRAANDKVRLTTSISSDVEIALTEASQVIYALWVSPINISKDPNSDDTLEYTRTFGLITNGIIYKALDNEDYLWNGWYNDTNPNYTLVDKSQVTTPKSGITYYTLENSIYTECENLTAWASKTDYYVISPIESSKTLTLTYDDTYKSLIETPQSFTGLNQYTAKWILAGITVTTDVNKGTVDKHKESNGTYTIYAEPLDGYRFVEWTHDNVNYSSTATTSNVPDASGVYVAVFETRSDIPYKVNIYLENLDGTETLVETISYADGTTSGYKDIDISTVQKLNTYSLTNYNLDYVCQNNDSSPLDAESGTTYRLSILNNEQGHLDCHYKLKTVSVTYHYNNGTTADTIDVKYDIANSRYNLQAIDNVTWYTDKALTPANVVTYVDANDEVWACYNGNNDLTANFGLNNNSLIENEYYYLAYTGTLTTDTDVVFPDYVDDKPVKKVNVDNLYKETKPYKSLTLPSELELIEYGTYNSKAISWIILSTTDNTGSKTYKLLSEKIIDSSTYRNIATVLNNIILTNYVTLTFENNLLSRTEVISSFYSTITLDKNMVPTTWWTNTRFINSNTGLETGTYYVKSVISDADTFTAVSNDKKNEAIGIRPTITITL